VNALGTGESRNACGRAAAGYGEGVRVDLLLAVLGAVIGVGGIVYAVLWFLAVAE
jgi:hypothetical protein